MVRAASTSLERKKVLVGDGHVSNISMRVPRFRVVNFNLFIAGILGIVFVAIFQMR